MSAIPCGIYTRISQDRDNERAGIDRQEQECRTLAERLGWDVAAIYSDNDLSAFSDKVRPDYQRLLSDIGSGKIRGVVAWHPDRLHRRPIELEHFISLVDAHEIQVHTVTAGDYNLSSPTGKAIARTIGAWARHESEHKGARIAAARKQGALEGKHHGGVRPYGFESDGMTIRLSEAAEVAKAADSIIAGISLRSIVRDLNERNIPTASGKGAWTGQVLRGILLSPRAAGLSSLHGEIVGKALWPAMIDEERWRAVGTILRDPKRKTSTGGTVKWLGSGIYICGVCKGRTLRVGVGTGGRRTYRCAAREGTRTSGHVTREATSLDRVVEEAVVRRLEQGIEVSEPSQEDSRRIDTLRNERAEIEITLLELSRSHVRRKITLEQLEIGTEELIERRDEIDGELAGGVQTGPLADLRGISDFSTYWFGDETSAGLSLARRRAILSAVADVTVQKAPRGPVFRPEYIQIDWK